jgi:Raf kinase inhibitor-like YbhB/YbcL family protein
MTIRRHAERATGASGPAPALTVAALLALASTGCWRGEPVAVDDPNKLTIALRSPAFADEGMIPKEFTCDGAGGSPPLECSGVPQNARELALIVDDPDAPMGTFSHWVVVGLPPGLKGLKEGVPAEGILPAASMLTAGEAEPKAGARQGKNDFGEVGYGGPCPPSGTHRYVFRLYALDAPLGLAEESPARSTVLEAVKGHILAEGRLIGRYARSK